MYIPVFHTNGHGRSIRNTIGVVVNCLVGMGLKGIWVILVNIWKCVCIYFYIIFNIPSIEVDGRSKTPYDPKYEIQHLMAPQRMGRKSPQLLTAPLLLSFL